MFKVIAIATLTCVSCCVLSGCHASHASADRASADPLEGHWKGIWRDTSNNHKGTLQCRLERVQDDELNSEDRGSDVRIYSARFTGTYRWIIPFWYKAKMEAVQRNSTWHLRSNRDLGKRHGGVFSCEGTVEKGKMEFRYFASDQEGIMILERSN